MTALLDLPARAPNPHPNVRYHTEAHITYRKIYRGRFQNIRILLQLQFVAPPPLDCLDAGDHSIQAVDKDWKDGERNTRYFDTRHNRNSIQDKKKWLL